MVKLVADVAVNNHHLNELSLLDSFKHLKFKDQSFNSFIAKDKDAGVTFKMSGTGFFYSNDKPFSGIVNKIAVMDHGDAQYKLSHLSIGVNNMESYFKGSISNVMTKLFDSNDKLVGSNAGDALYGYDGADVIRGKDGGDVLYGNKGNDQISGGSGNDLLKGGKGDDYLNGNSGKDTMTGGNGSDNFVFSSAVNGSNIDTITDMTPGKDQIDLDHSVFSAIPTGVLQGKAFFIGSAAHDATDRIVYDDANGKLYYTPDGNQSATQIQFAKLNAHLTLHNTDFFVM